jgi:hypothetical protein
MKTAQILKLWRVLPRGLSSTMSFTRAFLAVVYAKFVNHTPHHDKMKQAVRVRARVRRTGANRPVYRGFRCYRWPPVPVCTGAYRLGFKYFEFEFKKLKNETKIPKNTSRFIESNNVKFNLVHLVFFRSLQHQPK